MNTLRNICTSFAIGMAAFAGLAQTQGPAELLAFDGLPLGAAEADLLRTRPEARPLKGPRDDARSRYFLYQAEGLRLFDRAVQSVGRGFEGGRSCAVGVSLGDMTGEQLQALQSRLASAMPGEPNRRVDAGGNDWVYFTSGDLFASTLAVKPEPGSSVRTVTLSWSSRTCSAELAALRWQTRPR